MENQEKSKVVLWVEDNNHESSLAFIPESISLQNLKLREASGVTILRKELHEIFKEGELVKGIILDMLIYGSSDLSAFGISEISWEHDPSDVGTILLKHIFRGENNDFSFLNKTPVLILTVKPNINKSLLKNYEKVEIIHKYDDGNPNWKENVIKWIKSL